MFGILPLVKRRTVLAILIKVASRRSPHLVLLLSGELQTRVSGGLSTCLTSLGEPGTDTASISCAGLIGDAVETSINRCLCASMR